MTAVPATAMGPVEANTAAELQMVAASMPKLAALAVITHQTTAPGMAASTPAPAATAAIAAATAATARTAAAA